MDTYRFRNPEIFSNGVVFPLTLMQDTTPRKRKTGYDDHDIRTGGLGIVLSMDDDKNLVVDEV